MPNITCPKCSTFTHNTYKGLCRKCYRALPINKEKENAYSRKWYAENRESEIKTNAEYRRQNKELFDWYHNKSRFDGMKNSILERDNHACRICDTKEKLVVHHIDGSGTVRDKDIRNCNNNITNLITLCKSCHTKLHHWQRRNRQLESIEDIVRTLSKDKEFVGNSKPSHKR